jgi:serine/threonine protein kinase
VELSEYLLEALREDDEFVLYRGEHSNQPSSPSVLLLAPASTRPALETVKKIEHEYSLRDELDSAWAVRSLTLSEHRGQTTLVLEDRGGEPLDRFLPGPMQMPQFLRFAAGLATALGGLHKRELIHKDVKPANVLVDLATGQVRLMVGIEPTSSVPLGLIDCLDSNKKLKKSKCFIWCRIEAREPLFLSLSCTEFVPNSQSIQC